VATYRELLDELARRTGRHEMRGGPDFSNTARTALRETLERASVRHPFPWWITEATFLPDGWWRLTLPPDCVMVRWLFDGAGRRMRQREPGRLADYGDGGVPSNVYAVGATPALPPDHAGTAAWGFADKCLIGDGTAWPLRGLEGSVFLYPGDPEWAWIAKVETPTLMILSKEREGPAADGPYLIDPSGSQMLRFVRPLDGFGRPCRLVYSRRPRAQREADDLDTPDLPETFHWQYLLWGAYATLLEITEANPGSRDRARDTAEKMFREMVAASAHLLAERRFGFSSPPP